MKKLSEIKITRRKIKEVLIPVVLVYVLLHIFLFSNQRYLMYAPDTARSSPASAGAADMMSVSVHPADLNQSLEGWYKAPADPSKPVILYFHGDGGGIAGRAGVAQALIKQGYGVLLAEYRGYSGNPGSPGEAGFYADGDAYYDWLVKQEDISEKKIVLYGESLGSGITTYLASRHPNVGGMIIDGGFSSLTDVNKRSMPGVFVSLVYLDHYNNMDKINKVVCPILFIHGGRDRVVPLKMAEKLYKSANQPKTMKVFPEGGHVNLYSFGAMDEVKIFLASLK
ncbi:MAG: hypothetical protein JWO78_2108 [Micavibrio sp.]|nr:hypothetical protein [Micavibrio sp.]